MGTDIGIMETKDAGEEACGKAEEKQHQKWFPIESNPTLMNEYCTKLVASSTTGHNASTLMSLYEFVDVFSTEDWALDMIPQPVQAVMLLYPLTEKQLAYADSPDTILTPESNKTIWFTKQRIGNACGTIGLLHSLLNIPDYGSLIGPDSWLAKFGSDTPITMDPIDKANRLETDPDIAKLHDAATSSAHNQTNRGNDIDEDIITHFIVFVQSNDGNLYELDGRKPGPVRHDATTTSSTGTSSLLHNACTVIREKFMKRDPEELRFTILALAPAMND